MNILLISRGYPSNRDVQWGCFERDQAKALQKLGHTVTVMSIDGRFRLYKRRLGITQISDDGINVYNMFYCPSAILRLLGSKFFLKVLSWQTNRLYEEVKKRMVPDVIYAHYLTNIYSATIIKQCYNIPVVGVEHWSMLNRKVLPSYVSVMGNIGYRIADKLIAVSDSLKCNIYNHFSVNSIVIHNMIGEEFANRQIVDRKKIVSGKLNIIALGSLFYGKGYDILISAFAKTGLSKFGCKITIVGEGGQRTKLQAQIDGLGLERSIRLVGQKNKHEIIEIMDSCNLFIHPSRGENFSVAILEGLASGLPVIATLCGGAAQCINENNGLLVEVGDIDQLEKAIKYMYEHIDEYNNMEISNECLSKYSSVAIGKQIENVLNEVINR